MTKQKEKNLSIDFKELLSEKYLAYSLSTIMARSIPDVRDGLKPVHRRILYAMYKLNLDPNASFKKCARIIGDVIGKYHPHGEVAIYDSLVRLAQSFSLRYPLIEGQGNFGSIDGDNAAAMRYTESRLTPIASYLLDELNQHTVELRLTYDGNEEEPVILPAAFPNVIANGTEGIAVGMATSIPPHNLHELCDCLLLLIKKPEAGLGDLLQLMPGPDFPTGGNIIIDATSLLEIYETGKGSIKLRAKWIKEELDGGNYQIVITEIPYQVPKSRIIAKIAELFKEKRLPLIGDIRDESTDIIRLIIIPKQRHIEANTLMESLYKVTELEVRVHFNMNVLNENSIPTIMGLREILKAFLNHRSQIITNKANYNLSKINQRMEILEGYLIAYLNLDRVIHIIREDEDPKLSLMQKFNLTEFQAEAILNMRLRSLRKLEEIALKKEQNSLLLEKQNLEEILNSPTKLWQVIAKEIKQIQTKFGKDTELGERKTNFIEKQVLPDSSNKLAFIEKENVTFIYSQKDWIRILKGHNLAQEDITYKEGDKAKFIIEATTHDQIILFASDGKFYTLTADKLTKGRSFGEPSRMILDMESDTNIIHMMVYKPGEKFLLASKGGRGFCVNAEELIAQTKVGKQIFQISPSDEAYLCKLVEGELVAITGENHKLLIFSMEEVPTMKRGAGVKLYPLPIIDIKIFNGKDGLSWSTKSRTTKIEDLRGWIGKRGKVGKLPPSGFPQSARFHC